MTLSFDDFEKRLKAMGENSEKVFESAAKKAAIHFRNTAIKYTDEEKLVDTGNYRRNWNAEVFEASKDTYGIACSNSVEYASFLEEGHKLRNGKRWKGKFVGRNSIEDTRATLLIELDKEIDILFTMKDANVDRITARRWTGHTGPSSWNK